MSITVGTIAASAASADTAVTHNDIFIHADAERVWPHLVDVSAWKQSTTRLKSGKPGQIGEMREVLVPGSADALAYTITTVSIDPQRRRIIRLDTPDNKLIGFAIWSITKDSGSQGVTVSYDVLLDTSAEDEETPVEMRTRFQTELTRLKTLVERSK
jgi:hypothetical protein